MMKTLLLLAALSSHSITDQPVSPRDLPKSQPVSIVLSRGYFETRNGQTVEDHRNVIERAQYNGGRLVALVEVGLLDTVFRFDELRDAQGRVTESSVLRSGALHAAESRAYDPQGRLVDWKTFDDNRDLSLRRRYMYKKNRLIAEDVFGATRTADDVVHLERHVFSYDKAGKLDQETVYRMHPQKRVESVVVYDAAGRKIQLAEYDEWGEVKSEYVFEYEEGPDGLWAKQLKLKKSHAGEQEKLTPVDVLYREFSSPATAPAKN